MTLKKRKAISLAMRREVLHEAGYRCANPGCRGIITLDIHHIEYVSDDGQNAAENLLPLCPTCHALHHAGQIPGESIRAWKMLLLSLNDGFSRAAVDLLLALDHIATRPVLVTTDTVLMMGSLIASGLVTISHPSTGAIPAQDFSQSRFVSLSTKGSAFVAAWKSGNQAAAVNPMGASSQ
jgi:HNH endonuclease